MKKILITAVLSCCLFTAQAQQNDDKSTADASIQNFNEIKLNGFFLVLGAFEVAYERTLNEESAFGASIFVPFDNEIDFNINYYFSPYYRFYFGKKYAAGFFVEGFGMLNSFDSQSFTDGPNPVFEETNELAFALGIGLGGKWFTKSGFVAEVGLGIGRNIINNNEFDDNLVGKFNVSLGYRF